MKLCLGISCGLSGRLHDGPEVLGFDTEDVLRTSYLASRQEERLRESASDRITGDFEKRMRCVETPDEPSETRILSPLLAQEIATFLFRVSVAKWLPYSWQLAPDPSGLTRLRPCAWSSGGTAWCA